MLPVDLQKAVDAGVSGTDLLHGYMKTALLEAEEHLEEKSRIEEENDFSDAMESMDRTYAEGYLDALTNINSIIIDLAYAINERVKLRENV